MGYLKYMRAAWKKPKESEFWKERLMEWRRDPATTRIPHPTRIDRARSLGYIAKDGFVIVRQRVKRGGKMRAKIRKGRRSAHSAQKRPIRISYQRVCEERASKKYPNCEVLNSYYVAKDGVYIWYEILLLDREHPAILNDPRLGWIKGHRGRVSRGLTSSGKKGRGLRNKGKGAEKARPSRASQK